MIFNFILGVGEEPGCDWRHIGMVVAEGKKRAAEESSPGRSEVLFADGPAGLVSLLFVQATFVALE